MTSAEVKRQQEDEVLSELTRLQVKFKTPVLLKMFCQSAKLGPWAKTTGSVDTVVNRLILSGKIQKFNRISALSGRRCAYLRLSDPTPIIEE